MGKGISKMCNSIQLGMDLIRITRTGTGSELELVSGASELCELLCLGMGVRKRLPGCRATHATESKLPCEEVIVTVGVIPHPAHASAPHK